MVPKYWINYVVRWLLRLNFCFSNLLNCAYIFMKTCKRRIKEINCRINYIKYLWCSRFSWVTGLKLKLVCGVEMELNFHWPHWQLIVRVEFTMIGCNWMCIIVSWALINRDILQCSPWCCWVRSHHHRYQYCVHHRRHESQYHNHSRSFIISLSPSAAMRRTIASS